MSIRALAIDWGSWREATRRIAETVNQVADGRSNAFGSVTLTESTTTTAVTDRRVGTDSVIAFMPTTANAAAEIGAGTMYVGTVTSQSFTITHANNAQTDRTFKYTVQG